MHINDSIVDNRKLIDRLVVRASSLGCGRYLASISELDRLGIYTHYEYERLERKYNDLMSIYKSVHANWNQTIFMLLFRSLGDMSNRKTYMELARRVTYNNVLRERSDIRRVEALIIGASGLLDYYYPNTINDKYIRNLKSESSYLVKKYGIKPLSPSDWNFRKMSPSNHPFIRISQIATLFTFVDMILDKIIECKDYFDVENVFRVRVSDYWHENLVPQLNSNTDISYVDKDKCNSIAINVVVMLQYAYSVYVSNEELRDRAQNLLESLKAESNKYISAWRKFTLAPQNAFETQALIQIASEYCKNKRCKECYIAERAIKNLEWME